ncbi:MAG: hypothetical protein PF450_03950, partial [Bacteroidales bacterium]|nr:hypothetical protein [Bacteroidales bacterium]
MKQRSFLILCTLIGAFSILSCNRTPMNKVELQEINSGWEMSMLGENQWIPASVPGCVHTDLLNNGKIE